MTNDWWSERVNESKVIARDLLKAHEGLELKPYRCTSGKLTIGYGRNLEDKGITKEEATYMLIQDVTETYDLLCARYGWFSELNRTRQAVCIDMAYNLGMGGFHSFKQTRRHIANHDFDLAANEMLKSKWAEQVGDRAIELSKLMKEGV